MSEANEKYYNNGSDDVVELKVTEGTNTVHHATYVLSNETDVDDYFSAIDDHVGGRPKRTKS